MVAQPENIEVPVNYTGHLSGLGSVLKARLGGKYLGYSTSAFGDPIRVILSLDATAEDIALVEQIASVEQPIPPRLSPNYQSKSPINRKVEKWQSSPITNFFKKIL